MSLILEMGIALIIALQGLGVWLIAPMQFFTFLGSEEFFLLIAPVIYWCISSTVGLRVAIFLMLSGAINDLFKVAFHSPRPYWYDPRVLALSAESSFGTPSGHSQNAVAVWGVVANSIRKPWAWAAVLLIIILTGFARMYLGVHFPSDVLLGWLVGAVLLWVGLRYEGAVLAWLSRLTVAQRVAAAFVASLVMILAVSIVRLPFSAWTFPAEWAANIRATTQSAEPVNPWALSGLISKAGGLFGLVLGAQLLSFSGGFNAAGPWARRGLRFIVGIAGVLFFWRGLGLLLPSGEYLAAYLFRYLRYSLIGFWIAGLAPMLFIRLGLAEKNPNDQEGSALPVLKPTGS